MDAVMRTVQSALPESRDAIDAARRGELMSAPEFDLATLPPVVRDNLKLLFGMSLALGQLYDESNTMLAEVGKRL